MNRFHRNEVALCCAELSKFSAVSLWYTRVMIRLFTF